MPASTDSVIRRATAADFAAVQELLARAELPTAGVPASLDGYVVAVDSSGTVLGVAGLERYGREGLLRSVVVASNRRGSGLGRALSEQILKQARIDGVSHLYLLTTSAEGYFPKLGFQTIGRDRIPTSVQASVEFRGACPDSAVAMYLALS